MARLDHSLDRGEVIVPFPHGASRRAVALTTQFRATWLAGSLRALRERGYFDRYQRLLPMEFHDQVFGSVAGTWLPTSVAIAHYAACDRLEIPAFELMEIGHEVAHQVHGTVLGFIVKVAKGAGMTPWIMLPRLGEIWERTWIGGGVAVIKLGPKEARVEIAGWPCAATTYCRVAFRGILAGLIELFCERAYANEVPLMCTATTLGYKLSWV